VTDRLLPDKEWFEQYVLDKIIGELGEDGAVVADVAKGDTDTIPFDWLLRMEDGFCIGLEVVRAEDQEQVHHVEREHQAGAAVITGTVEMPWNSVRTAIEKKLVKADRYREAMLNLCPDGQLHLAITSGLQQLRFDGDIGEHMVQTARGTLGDFDVVWLVQGDCVHRIS